MFILGLILFFGMHLVPLSPSLRSKIVEKTSENIYMGVFNLVTVAGFLLIILGYESSNDFLYDINHFVYSSSVYIMFIAFVFLIASGFPASYIKKFSRHPMSIGIIIWGGTHLLVNPDLHSIILFGAFMIYVIGSVIFSEIRKKEGKIAPLKIQWDVLIILISAGITFLAFNYHYYLSGISL